jgi:hypothetical protein
MVGVAGAAAGARFSLDWRAGRLGVRRRGAGVAAFSGVSSGGGVCCAVAGAETSRLLITVFTPAICAASLAAAFRSISLETLPESVTTPPED